MKKILKKIKEAINNSILCIKYPFLYPRNRFTDTHYVNWKFLDYCDKLRKDSVKIGNKENHFKIVIINKPKYYLYKFLKWFHKWPMQLPFCLPLRYTELDAMEKGWRKAFGIQMCKEIKKAIIKSMGIRGLFKYRIMQIKEKWGELCWYDAFTTKEVMEVISKYEDISRKTCIDCGKPAKWKTTGWICPFCDDCIKDKVNVVNIEEECLI